MTREFIMLPEFEKQWQNMNLNDSDLKRVQEELILNPQKGAVIKGTGGLRKLRVAFEKRGKSKSLRLIYVDFVVFEKIYFITAYAKNVKDNLNKEEQNVIKKMVEALYNTSK
jgi:hypothetical protein